MDAKVQELKTTIREPFVWPGAYAKVTLLDDSEALCNACTCKEYPIILDSTRNNSRDGWQFTDIFVNWEDTDLYCAHCNERIPSEHQD